MPPRTFNPIPPHESGGTEFKSTSFGPDGEPDDVPQADTSAPFAKMADNAEYSAHFEDSDPYELDEVIL